MMATPAKEKAPENAAIVDAAAVRSSHARLDQRIQEQSVPDEERHWQQRRMRAEEMQNTIELSSDADSVKLLP